ncbi:MAG TPA: DUF4349 domain-containing protein [Gemmataceae bacterium]|jgi:hypothetical protein|nr:DUF4349 domain-containing protein [Gemmataceae bacterium]
MKTILLLAISTLFSLGCDEREKSSKGAAEAPPGVGGAQKPLVVGNPGKAPNPERPPQDAAQAAASTDRKIIRSAEIGLIVTDFDKAEDELVRLISQFKGAYIAQADVNGSAGSPRRGHWKVRLPERDLDAFRQAVVKLGVPERNAVDSQDVTEEYYDLDARIKNKKVEEQRLLKHLEKSTARLEEILTVEREIARVRGEIEQQEGRLRLLANLTSLTTASITAKEIKNYVPPQAPTFTSNIASTFSASFDLLMNLGKAVVLCVVALTPWLPILAGLGAMLWALLRRINRRVSAPSQVA